MEDTGEELGGGEGFGDMQGAGGFSQDCQLITSLLTTFSYVSVHTIQAECKSRTF